MFSVVQVPKGTLGGSLGPDNAEQPHFYREMCKKALDNADNPTEIGVSCFWGVLEIGISTAQSPDNADTSPNGDLSSASQCGLVGLGNKTSPRRATGRALDPTKAYFDE